MSRQHETVFHAHMCRDKFTPAATRRIRRSCRTTPKDGPPQIANHNNKEQKKAPLSASKQGLRFEHPGVLWPATCLYRQYPVRITPVTLPTTITLPLFSWIDAPQTPTKYLLFLRHPSRAAKQACHRIATTRTTSEYKIVPAIIPLTRFIQALSRAITSACYLLCRPLPISSSPVRSMSET